MQSYNDLSSPAKLSAFIDSEMSKIGKALAAMRQSIKSIHRGESTSHETNQKASTISERMYQVVRDIGNHRTALIRTRQAYRAQKNNILRIVRAMREISKIGENAQIDAIAVMQLQLISDAKRNLIQQKSEHVSAIRAVLNVQRANWIEFTKLSDRIDAWLREDVDVSAIAVVGTGVTSSDFVAVAAAAEYFAD